MMGLRFLAGMFVFCLAAAPAFAFSEGALPEDVEPALERLFNHIESVERVAYLYVAEPLISYPDGMRAGDWKRLVLTARLGLDADHQGDRTIRVSETYSTQQIASPDSGEPLVRYSNYYDGATTFSWDPVNRTIRTEPRLNHQQIFIPPSILALTELAVIWPIPSLRALIQEGVADPEEIGVEALEDGVEISFPMVVPVKVKFVEERGIEEIFISLPQADYRNVVDEFMQLESGHWVPKRGRLISIRPEQTAEARITVLKALINDDVPLEAFEPLAIADGDSEPASYIEAFFGIPLDEAYELLK